MYFNFGFTVGFRTWGGTAGFAGCYRDCTGYCRVVAECYTRFVEVLLGCGRAFRKVNLSHHKTNIKQNVSPVVYQKPRLLLELGGLPGNAHKQWHPVSGFKNCLQP